MSIFAVTGNGNGLAGFALSKATTVQDAIRKVKNRAGQKLLYIHRYNDHTGGYCRILFYFILFIFFLILFCFDFLIFFCFLCSYFSFFVLIFLCFYVLIFCCSSVLI